MRLIAYRMVGLFARQRLDVKQVGLESGVDLLQALQQYVLLRSKIEFLIMSQSSINSRRASSVKYLQKIKITQSNEGALAEK